MLQDLLKRFQPFQVNRCVNVKTIAIHHHAQRLATGEFQTPEECIAFARGVEEVLIHIVSIKAEKPHDKYKATSA